MAKKNTKDKSKTLNRLLNVSQVLNDNKVFAGVVMLIMNIGSKYINIELSKTQENYIKYSIGRQLIIFSILWVGTRDIFVSLFMTVLFILFADYLLNENSYYCIIPKNYREGIKGSSDNDNITVTEKDVNNAIDTLKTALKNKGTENPDLENTLYKENFI